MREKLLNFIKYNNTFTIIFVVVFFGFGISFAASPQIRDTVYASSDTITSVDNQLLLSTNLDNFNFNLKINSISDDARNYFVDYSYQTLAVENGVWQNKDIEKTLAVNKEFLGDKDLGLYAAKELGDKINYELSYLKKVQDLQKEKGVTQKVVTTEYSGLIGKLLNPKEAVIEGYNPVIPEPTPAPAPEPVLGPEVIPVVPPPAPKPPVNPPKEPEVPPATTPPADTPPTTPPTTPPVTPPKEPDKIPSTPTPTPVQVTITVTANQTKVAGTADPIFTYTSSDPAATFTGALGRAAGESVGSYAITQGTLLGTGNFTISNLVGANFTITAAPVPTPEPTPTPTPTPPAP